MARRMIILAGLALALMLAGPVQPVRAGVHQVWDEAHFFQAQTLKQVDQVLDEIQGMGKDLMIETFPSVPDDLKPNLQRDGKDKFFDLWTIHEAQTLDVNGVIILINGEPAHLQVAVGTETQKKAFTPADRDELVAQLTAAFRQKDFNGGILRAAQFVRDRISRNLGLAGAATQPTTQPAVQPTTRPAGEATLPEK